MFCLCDGRKVLHVTKFHQPPIYFLYQNKSYLYWILRH
ncbi:Uncharacterised protein [Vibrio cholerae]|uniref:Uncharacterized protein n=1 Tax=Vibrio cholerae TaxID=666 RepID=A0A655Y172_VIBCL|nr:Uncharacterised protein [Vibrio cholerae]